MEVMSVTGARTRYLRRICGPHALEAYNMRIRAVVPGAALRHLRQNALPIQIGHDHSLHPVRRAKATSTGTPVRSHGGIVCTGETYKNVVKMTFAKGAALKDPSGLFNSSLEGNVRRAIDIHEGEKIDEAALKDLIRAAVALNLKGKSKPKPRRASHKRAG